MLRIFRLAYDAVLDVRRKRANARLLEQLDERTLRDIGLETQANIARERTRLAFRLGAY
jgi:hypothetical protein